MRDSVEERIVQLQKKKAALVRGTLGAGGANKEEAKGMRVEELKLLFS